jgi:hypothetical protein
MASGQLESNSHSTTRLVNAWPDIRAWLLYTFRQWIVSGMFIGRQKQDRIEGFRSIIPFIDAVCRVPDLRELLLQTAYDRQNILLVLSFCWQMESEDWFEKSERNFPFTSAASPLVTLVQACIEDGKPAEDFFVMFELIAARAKRDPCSVASMALDRLKDATLSLRTLAPQIGMLLILGREAPYCTALLAQYSVQNVTRILVGLTSDAYDPAIAQEVESCIHWCLLYLFQSFHASDGCSLVAEALRTGVLPAIIRSSEWIAPDDRSYPYLMELFRVLSLYTIYPSVLWPFVASIRDMTDRDKEINHPVQDELEGVRLLIAYRFLQCLPGLGLKCQNVRLFTTPSVS